MANLHNICKLCEALDVVLSRWKFDIAAVKSSYTCILLEIIEAIEGSMTFKEKLL